jgi:cytochrome c553
MRKILLWLATGQLLVWPLALSSQAPELPGYEDLVIERLPGNAEAGETLATQLCAACHGPEGVGVGPIPPLAGKSEDFLVRTLHLLRAGKRESATMGLVSATMSDQQFADVAAYYSTLELPADTSPEPLHHVSAAVCQWCHEDVYKEWSGSMHAKSTALRDPIHEMMYRQEVGDPRAEDQIHKASQRYPVCLQCHAPNAARDKMTKLDAMPAYSEGVNCIACHQISGYKGVRQEGGGLRLGILAYETADVLQGPTGYTFDKVRTQTPEDPKANNPHVAQADAFGQRVKPTLPLEGNPQMLRSSDLCLGCHHLRPNPKGVPLCATGDEFEESGSQVTCQSCHMPIANGRAYHGMGGGHDVAMLSRAVKLTVDVTPNATGDGVVADVIMLNQLPHKLPTGAPFRNVQVKVTAFDDNGKVLWENFTTHAQKEAPEAYLFYQLADDEGKPAMPPVATRVGKDTRLNPHEQRSIRYEIPAKPAVVRAEMLYSLVFEGMKPRILELTDDKALLEPKRMAVYEARL